MKELFRFCLTATVFVSIIGSSVHSMDTEIKDHEKLKTSTIIVEKKRRTIS